MLRILTLAASVAVLGTTSACMQARAADLANNLSQTNSGAESITIADWTAQGFTTSATDFVITSITLKARRDAGTTGTLQLFIYDATGSGNTPGTSVTGTTHVATVSHTSLTTTLADVPFTGINQTLSPSTSYYLVVNAASAGLTGSFKWG